MPPCHILPLLAFSSLTINPPPVSSWHCCWTHADFDCKTALSGAEALRLLENDTRDAIVCDLNMPGMSGLELRAEVHRRSPRVAFLLATRVDDVRVGIQAMKSGADDYLVKPLQEELVIVSLHRALQKKGS
jgi:FixJ family two-component response regulator